MENEYCLSNNSIVSICLPLWRMVACLSLVWFCIHPYDMRSDVHISTFHVTPDHRDVSSRTCIVTSGHVLTIVTYFQLCSLVNVGSSDSWVLHIIYIYAAMTVYVSRCDVWSVVYVMISLALRLTILCIQIAFRIVRTSIYVYERCEMIKACYNERYI